MDIQITQRNLAATITVCMMVCMHLLSVVRPSLEYGGEVWESQAAALESVLLGGGKRILGCSSKKCKEAVRVDVGIDTLQGRGDKAKLKWWYKLVTIIWL